MVLFVCFFVLMLHPSQNNSDRTILMILTINGGLNGTNK